MTDEERLERLRPALTHPGKHPDCGRDLRGPVAVAAANAEERRSPRDARLEQAEALRKQRLAWAHARGHGKIGAERGQIDRDGGGPPARRPGPGGAGGRPAAVPEQPRPPRTEPAAPAPPPG